MNKEKIEIGDIIADRSEFNRIDYFIVLTKSPLIIAYKHPSYNNILIENIGETLSRSKEIGGKQVSLFSEKASIIQDIKKNMAIIEWINLYTVSQRFKDILIDKLNEILDSYSNSKSVTKKEIITKII